MYKIKRVCLSLIIFEIAAQWTIRFSNEEDGVSVLSMCSANDQIKMHECAFLSVTLAVHRGIFSQTAGGLVGWTLRGCGTAFLSGKGLYTMFSSTSVMRTQKGGMNTSVH